MLLRYRHKWNMPQACQKKMLRTNQINRKTVTAENEEANRKLRTRKNFNYDVALSLYRRISNDQRSMTTLHKFCVPSFISFLTER